MSLLWQPGIFIFYKILIQSSTKQQPIFVIDIDLFAYYDFILAIAHSKNATAQTPPSPLVTRLQNFLNQVMETDKILQSISLLLDDKTLAKAPQKDKKDENASENENPIHTSLKSPGTYLPSTFEKNYFLIAKKKTI